MPIPRILWPYTPQKLAHIPAWLYSGDIATPPHWRASCHISFVISQCELKIKVVKKGYKMASTLSIEHLTILGLSYCGSRPKVFHNGKWLKNVHPKIDGQVSHKKTNILTRYTFGYSSKEPGSSVIFIHYTRGIRSSCVRASIVIVHIWKFCKMHKDIVRFDIDSLYQNT